MGWTVGMPTDLAACMMPQIIPVDLELAMIIHMHQLVYQCLFHVLFAEEMVLAQDHGPRFRTEPTGLCSLARSAYNMFRFNVVAR